MAPPLRILRAAVQDHLHIQRHFTPRQLKQQNEILGAAEYQWAFHGLEEISLSMIAASLCIPPSLIRFYFADEHMILFEILRRHLIDVSKALGEWPLHTPDWRYRRCEIYLRQTHYAGGVTLPHVLLKRDRHKLPADLQPIIEKMFAGIMNMLGGENAYELANILDDAFTTEARLPEALARLFPADPPPQPMAVIESTEPAPPKPQNPGRFSPTMPPHIALALESGDLSYLRPKGLGSMADGWHDRPDKPPPD